MTDSNPYVGAYPWLARRRGVWREIVRYVKKDAPGAETVLELGAGYCDFINQFPAPRRLAFDLNPEMKAYAEKGVDLRIEDCTNLPGVEPQTVDFVFASNFLEHFAADEADVLLSSIARVLRRGGRIALLQPNYLRCADRYFDDPTHKTIFDHRNVAGILERHGFRIVKLEPGLLPFSMNNRAPKWPLLVRLYLMSPVRPLAAQMYVVAERT
ncbi:MAG: Methyltransferase type 11 [bacterium]|nr:Methyltransferase type 11 [bacterium]